MPFSQPYFFPLFLVAVWLVVTTLLGFLSRWFTLARKFPDQIETAILALRGQSGSMGLGVNMNGVLRLSVCPSGLRVGIFRALGPFCNDFFVPWSSITIERRTQYFMHVAEFKFSASQQYYGGLILPEYLANRLATASGEHWPESKPIESKTRKQTLKSVFYYWLGGTAIGSTFFLCVSRVAPPGGGPPWWICVGFPASVFAVVSGIRYLNTVRHS